jgi:hypothetical protein
MYVPYCTYLPSQKADVVIERDFPKRQYYIYIQMS